MSLMRFAAFLIALMIGVPIAAAEPRLLAPGERLEGRFMQERTLEGLAAPLRSQGRFVVVPEQGVLWRGEVPFETATVISRNGILQMLPGADPTRISAARAPFVAQFYDMLGAALAGDWRALERGFAIDRRETASGGWRVGLTPKDSTIGAQIRSITVSGGDFVQEIEIAKPGGDREHLRFSDQRIVAGRIPEADERLFGLAAR